MTVRTALSEGLQTLQGRVDTPYLDSVLLLGHALGVPKEHVLASLPDEVPKKVEDSYRGYLVKRLRGVPVSYIRRRKEFYSLDFYVDERVLVPRPETEIIVDTALAIAEEDPSIQSIHDCCTGSGCIGITVKHEQPKLKVRASDISTDAIEVFKKNSRDILGQVLPVTQSDLLSAISDSFDIIMANPPYLQSDAVARLMQSGWVEPQLALDGGSDGLALCSRLIEQCSDRVRPGGYLLIEADPHQMSTLSKMCVQWGFGTVILYEDFSGHDRVLRARKDGG